MSSKQSPLEKISANSINENGIVAYQCNVMHQRLRPFTYKFCYRIMSVCIDVDKYIENHESFSWLRFNKFGLMSIYTRDFGSRDGADWRHWITDLLTEYGIEKAPSRIILACMPRCIGVGFNPLAMWYAYNEQDELIAVIAEVSNTFGHFHHYVLSSDGNVIRSKGNKYKATAQKQFHVSPFLGMDCRYHFIITLPDINTHSPYLVTICESEDGIDTLIAAQTGRPIPLPVEKISVIRLGYWFTSIKTIIGIHWWALKIVLKGGKFRRTPKSQRQKTYGHSRLYAE